MMGAPRTLERVGWDGEVEKLCRKCGEWWPLTAEFWYGHDGKWNPPCKACQTESKQKLIDTPCCVEGCDQRRHINKSGRVEPRCLKHQREKQIAYMRKQGEVMDMDIDKHVLTEAQKQTLLQVAIRSRGNMKEWVEAGDCDLRSLRALAARQLLVLDVKDEKRLVRVTAAGWRETGEPKPDFYGDDLKPMERDVVKEGHYDPEKVRIVVESKRRANGTVLEERRPIETPPPAPARHQEDRIASGLPAAMLEPIGPDDGLPVDEDAANGHDCDGCVLHEVVAMLARKDPRVGALVETLERERALLHDLGLDRPE